MQFEVFENVLHNLLDQVGDDALLVRVIFFADVIHRLLDILLLRKPHLACIDGSKLLREVVFGVAENLVLFGSAEALGYSKLQHLVLSPIEVAFFHRKRHLLLGIASKRRA